MLLLALDHRTEGFWTIAVLGVVVLVLVFMIVVKGINEVDDGQRFTRV